MCPFCSADQTQPVEFANPYLPQPRTLQSFLHDWGRVILVLVAFAGTMAGILWHNFSVPTVSPASKATVVAAKSLRDVREALSTYALSTKDSYPADLNSFGERVSLPMQAALAAGYRLEYSPKPASNDSAPRGFVILARPEKNGYPNLFIDESGVVRATKENQLATLKDPPL